MEHLGHPGIRRRYTVADMTGFQVRQDFVKVGSGLPLWIARWIPEARAGSGKVVFIHGFLEHSGRYHSFLSKLAGSGTEVLAFDLRGHGHSGGRRAWFRSIDELLADLSAILTSASWVGHNEKVLLIGHSLGGLIAAQWSLQNQAWCRGLVLLAPAIAIGAIPPWLRALAPFAAAVLPWAKIVRMGAKALSRDPRVVDDFMNDPLVYHGRIPTRTGYVVLQAAARLRRSLDRVSVPFLVLHGTGDRICLARGSAELFARAQSPDKTFRLYPGFYHDLLHEPEAAAVEEDILRWLSFRL